MSVDNNDDEILIELIDEEIEEFRVFYKELDHLEFVHVHLYLKNHLRWNQMIAKMSEDESSQISDRCKMKFYKNRFGKLENRSLIGITGDKEYSIFIMSLDKSELYQALMKTKLIKWHQLPLFVAVHRNFHELMHEIFESKNVRVRIDNSCSTMHMNKQETSNYDFSVPDNVEMRSLKVENYKLMNDIWPYKYPGSECFIKSIIKLNGGLGVYKNDELLSWILQVECFGLGFLQTLDEHQGKGYARLLTRTMARRIGLELNEDVILFASHSKPKTVDLYIRYGYKHVSHTHWFYLKQA